jgi:hypothetical protein
MDSRWANTQGGAAQSSQFRKVVARSKALVAHLTYQGIEANRFKKLFFGPIGGYAARQGAHDLA